MTNISQKWLNGIDGTALAIARVFTQNYAKKMHGSDIAKRLCMPQKTVSRKLNRLCNLGVLKYVREGKNKLYFIDKESPFIFHFLVLVESYKAVKFLLGNQKISSILKDISCGKIIFGSYANDTKNKNSDLDIVFLCKKNRKVEEALGRFPVNVHAQFSTIQDLRKKLREKNTLALEIAENHIILDNLDEVIKLFMEYWYG